MAVSSWHKPSGLFLTSLGPDAKAGDKHLLSSGSYAYSLCKGTFGWRGCEFTEYTLPEPTAYDDRFGEPLFNLENCGRCPIDGSLQNATTRDAAEARWSGWVADGSYIARRRAEDAGREYAA